MRKTYELNKKIKPDGVITSIFYPFPGTKIFKMLAEENKIDMDIIKRIYRGEGSYKGGGFINGIDKRLSVKYMRYLPLMIKLPSPFNWLLLKLPYFNLIDFIFLPFISIPRNFYIRLKEFISSLYRTWRYYIE